MSDNYNLPDSFNQRADELNALEGRAWRGKAQLTMEALESANGTPKMIVYQKAAYKFKAGVSTITMYVGMEQAFGAVLNAYKTPDGDDVVSIAQLRRIHSAARKNKVKPDEELLRHINLESDEWGGLVAPPDVIAAQTRAGRETDPPELRALKSAARSLSTYLRHCESKPDRINVEAWVKWIEKRIGEMTNEA